ncbi:MAG: hypothetical protein ABTR20_13405 [Candidatus Competibacter sp.]
MSATIKSEIKLVTPEMAKQFLIYNDGNRHIREAWVSYLAYCIKNNEWQQTHQGIAFSEDGRLLDGQHRLLAVIKADQSINMLITTGLKQDAFMSIDNLQPRTDRDRTRLSKDLVEACKFFIIKIMKFEGLGKEANMHRVTPVQLFYYADIISGFHESLMKRAPSRSRVFTSVPGRCAAIASMMISERSEYVIDLYRKFSLGHTDDLPPIARSLVRQALTGEFSTHGTDKGRVDNFLRMMLVFKEKNQHIQKLILKNQESRLIEIREKLKPWFSVSKGYSEADALPKHKGARFIKVRKICEDTYGPENPEECLYGGDHTCENSMSACGYNLHHFTKDGKAVLCSGHLLKSPA